MKGNPEERALKMAEYIAESGATVRRCAQIFGVSKIDKNKKKNNYVGKITHKKFPREIENIFWNF